MALFDAYLLVDWSAAAVPRRGRDSIWLHHRRRDAIAPWVANPTTRLEARALLLRRLEEDMAQRRRTLVGFDFPLGYPAGVAQHLGLGTPPWRSLWTYLSQEIAEGAENANNRFAVAARMNTRLTGDAAPFWGCPPSARSTCLASTAPLASAPLGIAQRRRTEFGLTAQPVWKLYGNGSVGGQALTGIPVVSWLRQQLEEHALVWPFETGLREPGEASGGRAILAEIYPSLRAFTARDGEVRDAAQLRCLADHFATLDEQGELAALLAGDPALTAAERTAIECEEGWILGAGANAPTPRPRARDRGKIQAAGESPLYDYLRDPAAIYRESFARIEHAADMARLPATLRPVALRLAHAAGDVALLDDLIWSDDAIAAGQSAIAAGAPILVDSAMVAAGINSEKLTQRNPVICTLRERRVPRLAQELGTTRSAAATELWRRHLAGAVVAIGNAPTALFHLLEMIGAGAAKPALILGFPVGFVGAAEAKEALAANPFGLAFLALRGRRGGSALAASAVNALAADAGSA